MFRTEWRTGEPFIALVSNALWSAALPSGDDRWLFPAGSTGEGGKPGVELGMWNPEEVRGKQSTIPTVCHAIWQSRCLSSYAALSLGHRQVSAFVVPLQHGAGVLWVRSLPLCLWFELSELAQLAAELYSPEEVFTYQKWEPKIWLFFWLWRCNIIVWDEVCWISLPVCCLFLLYGTS